MLWNPGLLRVTDVKKDIQHDGIRFGGLKADSWALRAERRWKKGVLGAPELLFMTGRSQGRCHVSRGTQNSADINYCYHCHCFVGQAADLIDGEWALFHLSHYAVTIFLASPQGCELCRAGSSSCCLGILTPSTVLSPKYLSDRMC